MEERKINKSLCVNANAICMVCGTARENPNDGCCINDHDDWVEKEDGYDRLLEAAAKFNTTIGGIIHAIRNNICLTNNK